MFRREMELLKEEIKSLTRELEKLEDMQKAYEAEKNEPYNLNETMARLVAMMKKERIRVGEVVEVKYEEMYKCWGKCHREWFSGHGKYIYTITINKDLGNKQNPIKELEETLLHELIHTVVGCFDHGKEFHRVGRLFDEYGYNVQTTSNKVLNVETKMKGYTIECECCKKTYEYRRASKTVKYIANGNKGEKYGCQCGSHSFKVTYFDGKQEMNYRG